MLPDGDSSVFCSSGRIGAAIGGVCLLLPKMPVANLAKLLIEGATCASVSEFAPMEALGACVDFSGISASLFFLGLAGLGLRPLLPANRACRRDERPLPAGLAAAGVASVWGPEPAAGAGAEGWLADIDLGCVVGVVGEALESGVEADVETPTAAGSCAAAVTTGSSVEISADVAGSGMVDFAEASERLAGIEAGAVGRGELGTVGLFAGEVGKEPPSG